MDFKVELPSLVRKVGEPAFTVALPAPVALPKPTPINVPVVLPPPVKIEVPPSPELIKAFKVLIPDVITVTPLKIDDKPPQLPSSKFKSIPPSPPSIPAPKKMVPEVLATPVNVPVDKPAQTFMSYTKESIPDDDVRVPLNRSALTNAVTNWYESKDHGGKTLHICCYQQKNLTISLVVREVSENKYMPTLNIYGDKCVSACQIKMEVNETLRGAKSSCVAGAGAMYCIFEKLYVLGQEGLSNVEN